MKLLCSGKSITKGVVIGKIVIVSECKEPLEKIGTSSIVLVENSSPINAIYFMKAGGVIIKVGGILSHSCLLAIEIGVPCITQVGENIAIENGQAVLLDAGAGKVYEYKEV